MKKARAFELPPAERAALERLAKRGDRVALRARYLALRLVDGEGASEAAKRLRVTRESGKAWERRFEKGGAKALFDRPGRGRRPAVPAAPVPSVWKELAPRPDKMVPPPPPRRSRGRPEAAAGRIAGWVRDAVALGALPPDSALPGSAWFEETFRASHGAVQRAFAALGGEGFVASRPRGRRTVASPPPFENRYLLLLGHRRAAAPGGAPGWREGLDLALLAAAKMLESRRGVAWDIRPYPDPGTADREALRAEIRRQKWAGVFLRFDDPADSSAAGGSSPGVFLGIDRVPVCGLAGSRCTTGSHAVRLAPRSPAHGRDATVRAMFEACRKAGRRVALVLHDFREGMSFDAREARIRAQAREAGVEIPPYMAVECLPTWPESIRNLVGAPLRTPGAQRLDAVVMTADNYVEETCRLLVERFGRERASRIRVAALGNLPPPFKPQLEVHWHGDDWLATLELFVAWCEAIHAGEANPRKPYIVTR